ncbi:MAG: PAS domain S-box protein, partial [Vitreoscilla sp.]|nr:PAS domain S-box protein [Polaromonas sp.]
MPGSKTLRSVMVAIVVVAIAPLFVFSVISAVLTADRDLASSRKNLEIIAALVAKSQESVVDSAHQLLFAVAKVPRLIEGADGQCAGNLRSLNADLKVYFNIGIICAEGTLLCQSVATAFGNYAGDRPYFQAALARDSFVASGYLLGYISQKPMVTLAFPIKDTQSKTNAVAFAVIHVSELAKAFSTVKLREGSHIIIMDRAGIVLADNIEASTAIGKQVGNPMLQRAILSRKLGMLEGPAANGVQKMYTLAQTSPASDSAFYVAVGMDRDAVVEPAKFQLTLAIIALLLVTAVGCLLAWVVGGRAIMKPALAVIKATQNIQAGHLDARIPDMAGGPDHELNRIASGFNQMADTIRKRELDLVLELSRTEQAWKTLDLTINSLQDGLIAVDSEARVVLVNEAASHVFDNDPDITPMSAQWPMKHGLFVPCSNQLYDLKDLPLYKALQGQSGGPQKILVKNKVVPDGRLISVVYRPMIDGQGKVGGLMVFTDITEVDELRQKTAKKDLELRASQRELLDAQILGRMGHWQLDETSQQISWSDEMSRLFGLATGTFDGRQETFLQFIHPADRERYAILRDIAIQNKTTLEIEYRIVTPDGQTRWMHQIGKAHVDKKGKTSFRAGVVQDITERKQTELALARSTELLHRTGKMALVAGWEISFAPLTTHWTDEIFLIRELEPGTRLSARRAIRFFTRDAQPLFLRAVRAAMAHGLPWDLELPLITAKGRRIWVRTQGQAVYQDGVLFGLSGVSQDITTQHNALAQLRLLETCVSRLNDIVLITEAEPLDEPGPRIVFVNDAFERRTGYTREEVIGKTPRILQGPNTQRFTLKRIGAALKKWQPVRAELINYTKTGEEFWIELDMVPVANTEGWFTHWIAVERDITQRKLAEQALRDSEQRYFALFEDAPVTMWVYDAGTYRFLAVNSAATNEYGYSHAEFSSMSIFDVRSEAESQRLKKYLALETPDSSQCWLHRRKDGSELTVRGINKAIQYAGKCAMFVVVLDVSAQVKAENEVSDYLATLQRAAVATQAIPLHLSLYGLMDEVAVQIRAVIGAHQAVVSLCSDTDWSNASHTFSLSEKYADYAVGGAESASDSSKLLSMGGADVYATACKSTQAMRLTQAELESHPGWLDAAGFANHRPAMRGWMAIPLVGRSGTNIGLLQLSDKFKGDFTLQDEYVATELAQLASIAIENAQLLEEVHQLNTGLEQKVARRTAALARQEALFRAVAEQAPQVIWTADLSGRVTFFNRAWFDLMGGQLHDWDGLKWLTAIHAEDLPQVNANWVLAIASQTPYAGVRRLLAKDGSYHVMSYRASPVLNAEGKVDFWVGIDADVSEIKAVEAALLLSNQELESFSYSVSHDLRSPLNTIDGFSRLLSKQLGTNVSDKEKHFLARIQAGVAQMGKLIEDLLSLAQVSRMQLQHEAVDLTVISQHIAQELQARQPDRAVTAHIEDGLHAYGDAGLIRIVMENLMGNAWKFTSHMANADVRVGQKTDAAGLPVFFVSDNGAGFDMAYADKLFVAFQRLH